MFRQLCGKSTLENVIIVTSMWDDVLWGVGEARESELTTNFFKLALDKGAQLVRYRIATQSSAHDIIRRVTRNLSTSPGNQQEFVDESTNPELYEWIRRELKAIQEEMIRGLRDQEEKLRREFEQDIRKVREQMRAELERMAAYHDEEVKRMKTEMERMAVFQNESIRLMETNMGRVQERAHLEVGRLAADINNSFESITHLVRMSQ